MDAIGTWIPVPVLLGALIVAVKLLWGLITRQGAEMLDQIKEMKTELLELRELARNAVARDEHAASMKELRTELAGLRERVVVLETKAQLSEART